MFCWGIQSSEDITRVQKTGPDWPGKRREHLVPEPNSFGAPTCNGPFFLLNFQKRLFLCSLIICTWKVFSLVNIFPPKIEGQSDELLTGPKVASLSLTKDLKYLRRETNSTVCREMVAVSRQWLTLVIWNILKSCDFICNFCCGSF